jgi:DNA repair protein RadC
MSNIIKYDLKKEKTDFPKTKIMSSKDAADFIKQFYSDDIECYESMFILLLNRSNTTIGFAKISQGGVTGTVVDPKIICKYIVDSLASCAILAHNHPSGFLSPSENDLNLTQKIKKCVSLFESKLLDHLILSTESYYSFADEGVL